MRFTKRVQFVLWICLISVIILFRLPSTPHEIGFDSVEMHVLANSVSAFGEARWWINSLSVGGFYPYSYASAVPFMLSGISQCTGIDMEWTIWLFCVVIGLLSAFAVYLVAGAIWENDIFKFLVVFGYSTSQGILTYTTWTVTTRGFLIALLPLFVYTLLKCRTSAIRYGIFTFVLFVLLMLTHHLFYFTIPLIMACFIIAVLYKLSEHINIKEKIPTQIYENIGNIAMCAIFLVMLSLPFFMRSLWETDIELGRSGINSRYTMMLPIFSNYVRYVGIPIFFVIGGYSYLLFKREKRFEEWFLLISVACLAPLLYMPTYMKQFAGLFAFLLIGVAITNIATIKTHASKKKKYIWILIVILLLLSTSFSGYYQYIHFLNEPSTYKSRYMEEATYAGGLWIKESIDKNIFYNNRLVGLRAFAVSGVPTLFGGTIAQTYGFEDVSELNITKNSPLSVEFYKDGPYVKTLGTPYLDGRIGLLMGSGIESRWGKRLISQHNISYVIEDEDIGDNVFIRSVHPVKNNVYDNGKIRIWSLN